MQVVYERKVEQRCVSARVNVLCAAPLRLVDQSPQIQCITVTHSLRQPTVNRGNAKPSVTPATAKLSNEHASSG
jgi:hypothetical protein